MRHWRHVTIGSQFPMKVIGTVEKFFVSWYFGHPSMRYVDLEGIDGFVEDVRSTRRLEVFNQITTCDVSCAGLSSPWKMGQHRNGM
jgi:hypothetical protein